MVNAAAGAVDWALGTGDRLQWFRRLLSAHAAARNTETGLETMKQIDSQLMMRNYEGFLRT